LSPKGGLLWREEKIGIYQSAKGYWVSQGHEEKKKKRGKRRTNRFRRRICLQGELSKGDVQQRDLKGLVLELPKAEDPLK